MSLAVTLKDLSCVIRNVIEMTNWPLLGVSVDGVFSWENINVYTPDTETKPGETIIDKNLGVITISV